MLGCIVVCTLLWATQWKHMQFTHSEANLLPDDHPENIRYQNFLKTFGEEGNIMTIAFQNSDAFPLETLKQWAALNEEIATHEEIDFILSVDNLTELVKDTSQKRFTNQVLSLESVKDSLAFKNFKQKLFLELPFYENLLYDKRKEIIRSIIFMKGDVVNTRTRKTFVFETFVPLIESFEKSTQIDVKISGMPYVRTLNAQSIIDEISIFVISATLITSLIFFLFFRSFRATFISMLVVSIGVMWALGVLGLLRYEITVLTALIPPLIIVIGVPNCIFLINKYQHEIALHGNQTRSLKRVITRIGNATLMTNLTTASGFATFALTNSRILKEFGIVASLNIVIIFLLSILIIPITYSLMPLPKKKHLRHLKNRNVGRFVKWMEHKVRHQRVNVYIISLIALVLGIIGMYQIKISGNLLEDMPQKAAFFDDIRFFDKSFNGIIPIEILVDSKRGKRYC